MTYALLCAVFLVAALALAAIAWRRAPHGHASSLALSAAALVVLTAVFDNVMIATGLFGYADGQISGMRLGLAPIEDFAYPVAGVLLLPAVWNLFGGRREASAHPEAPESAEASARPGTPHRERRADGDTHD